MKMKSILRRPIMKSRRLALRGLVFGATLLAVGSLQVPAAEVFADQPTQRIYVNTPALSLQTLALISTDVALVRIEGQRAQFPERGLATTVYTATRLTSLKGSEGEKVEFEVVGARNNSQWVVLENAPNFAEGEEVLLFLWRSPDEGTTGVLGLGQGTYRVSRDANGGRRVTGEHANNQDLDQFLGRVSVEWRTGLESAENMKEAK